MPALTATFIGDTRGIDAAYAKTAAGARTAAAAISASMDKTAVALERQIALSKLEGKSYAEAASALAILNKERANYALIAHGEITESGIPLGMTVSTLQRSNVTKEAAIASGAAVNMGSVAQFMSARNAADYNRYINSPSQFSVPDRYRNEQDAKLWAEKFATAKAQAAPRMAQRAEDLLSAGITGSQVTRVTGMTDRLARLRSEMAKGGKAAEAARVEIRMLASAQGIGAIEGAVNSAAHNGTRLSSIMREVTVIFREVAMGRGAGRIIGSASLLAQYTWKGFLKALLSIPGLVAIAGAAIFYFVHEHLKKVNEALDKTAESMSHAFGDRQKANVDAMMDAARAAGELKSRIKELGDAHETLSQQLDESLQSMNEEFQMMQKIAQLHGQTPAQQLAAEQENRRKQLDLINQTLDKQKRAAEAAKKADEDATAAAFTSNAAKDRNARLKDMPGQLDEARSKAEELKKIVEELSQKEDSNVEALNRNGMASQQEISDFRKRFGSANIITQSGESWTLDNARQQLRQYQDLVKKLPMEMAALEETQRELSAAQSKAAQGDTQAASDVLTLTKRRDELQAQIGLHDKYDSQTASLEGGRGNGTADLSANQRIGAFTMPMQTTMIDIARQQVARQDTTNVLLKQIETVLSKNGLGSLVQDFNKIINGPFGG